MQFDLETTIAQRLHTSREAISPVLRAVVERIRQQVAHYGYARVSGLGTFRGGEADITFEPDQGLAEAVNLRFTGLRDVVLPSSSDPDDVESIDEEGFYAGEPVDDVDVESTPVGDEDAGTEMPRYTEPSAPPRASDNDWTSTSPGSEVASGAEFEGTEDPLGETGGLQDRWTEAVRGSDIGDSPSPPAEIPEGSTPSSASYRWDAGAEEPPASAEPSDKFGWDEGAEEPPASAEPSDKYGWDADDAEREEEDERWALEGVEGEDVRLPDAGAEEAEIHDEDEGGIEAPSVTWRPIDEGPGYGTTEDDPESVLAGASAFDELDPDTDDDDAYHDESAYAAEYDDEADFASGSAAAGTDYGAEFDEGAGYGDDTDRDETADYAYSAEYEEEDTTPENEGYDDEEHVDRRLAGLAGSSLAPDRHSRPHEWHRQQSRAKRAAAGAMGEGAGGGPRTVLWVGVGLIVVAAAAIAFFMLSPFDAGEPTLGERQESQALLDTSEAAAAADTAAGEATPAESPGESTESAAGLWEPLQSSDGIDFTRDGYTIVVYSETSRARADEAAERLHDAGFRTGVLEEQDNGATRLRVGVGQFATVEEAVEARDSLAGSAIPNDAWVLRVQ